MFGIFTIIYRNITGISCWKPHFSGKISGSWNRWCFEKHCPFGWSATARVTSYLQSLYDSVAETLPDIRDDPGVETELMTGLSPLADSYADALSARAALPFSKKSCK